jgi:hypothetical protein
VVSLRSPRTSRITSCRTIDYHQALPSRGGVELDAKYQIVVRFTLPIPFLAALSIDMNARSKYDAYVVEVLTDKDGDPVKIAPGELFARTPEPVPLGTKDLRIELDALRE